MSTDLARTGANANQIAERPDYIANLPDQRKGTEELARVIRPSFVKIIQAMTAQELKKQFGEGSLILTPDLMLLTSGGDESQGVKIVPILFYTEYCKWAPLGLKGVEPMIVDRSFDSRSRVAIKSQSSATWSEPHPNYPNDQKMAYRYCEHINFIVKLMDDDLLDLPPVLVSFVKSSYGAGQLLSRLVMRRKAPIFAGQYRLGSHFKEIPHPHWVLSVDDYTEEPWVPAEVCSALAHAHDEYDELLKAKRIQPDYEELGEAEDASFNTDGFGE